MNRTRIRALVGATIVVGLLAGSAVLVPAAFAAAPTLTTTFSPSSAGAGSATTFTLTASSNQGTLQSLSLTSSSGVYVKDASASDGTAQVSGNQTINVTGLKISGSAMLTLTITAFPQCTPETTASWNLTAVQKGGAAYAPQGFS